MGKIPSESIVLKARPTDDSRHAAYAPPPIEEVVVKIRTEKPDVVFAPHVETSSGMILPDEYILAVSDAIHSVGGLFVLDCIASGAIWIDMEESGVDVLISAPQKGWSGSPCCGLVMLSASALESLESTTSTSFACDLGKWHQIMQAYLNGGHAYHATMPTDALSTFRDVTKETITFGLNRARGQQLELGQRVLSALTSKGLQSVAATGYQAPGVIVCYTDDKGMHFVKKFKKAGIQIAAGVPLRCDEDDDFQTFRIGLFGLDKLQNVDRTVAILEKALNKIL